MGQPKRKEPHNRDRNSAIKSRARGSRRGSPRGSRWRLDSPVDQRQSGDPSATATSTRTYYSYPDPRYNADEIKFGSILKDGAFRDAMHKPLTWFNNPAAKEGDWDERRYHSYSVEQAALLRQLYTRLASHYILNESDIQESFNAIQRDYKVYRLNPLQSERKEFPVFAEHVSSIRLREFIKNLRVGDKGEILHAEFNDDEELPPMHRGYDKKTPEDLLKENVTSLQKILPKNIQEKLDLPELTEDEQQVKTVFEHSNYCHIDYDKFLLHTEIFNFPWNPINCELPYSAFIAIINRLDFENQKKQYGEATSAASAKSTLPIPKPSMKRIQNYHNICKYRYVEYIHKLHDTTNEKLLVALITAYGVDATKYPAKVFEFLSERNLLIEDCEKRTDESESETSSTSRANRVQHLHNNQQVKNSAEPEIIEVEEMGNIFSKPTQKAVDTRSTDTAATPTSESITEPQPVPAPEKQLPTKPSPKPVSTKALKTPIEIDLTEETVVANSLSSSNSSNKQAPQSRTSKPSHSNQPSRTGTTQDDSGSASNLLMRPRRSSRDDDPGIRNTVNDTSTSPVASANRNPPEAEARPANFTTSKTQARRLSKGCDDRTPNAAQGVPSVTSIQATDRDIPETRSGSSNTQFARIPLSQAGSSNLSTGTNSGSLRKEAPNSLARKTVPPAPPYIPLGDNRSKAQEMASSQVSPSVQSRPPGQASAARRPGHGKATAPTSVSAGQLGTRNQVPLTASQMKVPTPALSPTNQPSPSGVRKSDQINTTKPVTYTAQTKVPNLGLRKPTPASNVGKGPHSKLSPPAYSTLRAPVPVPSGHTRGNKTLPPASLSNVSNSTNSGQKRMEQAAVKCGPQSPIKPPAPAFISFGSNKTATSPVAVPKPGPGSGTQTGFPNGRQREPGLPLKNMPAKPTATSTVIPQRRTSSSEKNPTNHAQNSTAALAPGKVVPRKEPPPSTSQKPTQASALPAPKTGTAVQNARTAEILGADQAQPTGVPPPTKSGRESNHGKGVPVLEQKSLRSPTEIPRRQFQQTDQAGHAPPSAGPQPQNIAVDQVPSASSSNRNFTKVLRSIQKWYGHSSLPDGHDQQCIDNYVKHVLEFRETKLRECMNQLVEDHRMPKFEILKQYFLRDSGIVELPSSTRQTKMKAGKTSFQQALADPTNSRQWPQPRNDCDNWDPFRIPVPYQLFVDHAVLKHIRRPSTIEGTSTVPNLNDDICKLRYVEYMNEVAEDNARFLIAVFTAYDSNIECFPLRAIQFLQRRKLLNPLSVFLTEDLGPITRVYSDISPYLPNGDNSAVFWNQPAAAIQLIQPVVGSGENKKREGEDLPGPSPKKARVGGTDVHETPIIQFYDIPFEAWKYICQKTRSQFQPFFPNTSCTQPLEDEECRKMYARYLCHIEDNYEEFVRGMLTAYPGQEIPDEILKMFHLKHTTPKIEPEYASTINQPMQSTSTSNSAPRTARPTFQDEEEDILSAETGPVVYDYRHGETPVATPVVEDPLAGCYQRPQRRRTNN